MSALRYHQFNTDRAEVTALIAAHSLTTAPAIIADAQAAADAARYPEALALARHIVRQPDATPDQIAASCEVLVDSPDADDRLIAHELTERHWPAQCSPQLWAAFNERTQVSGVDFMAVLFFIGGAVVAGSLIGWAITAAFTAYNAALFGGIL